MNKFKNKYILIPIVTGIISLILLGVFNFSNINTSNKKYLDFRSDVSKNLVSEVYITNSPTMSVKLKNGTIYQTDNPRLNDFKEDLLQNNIKVSETPYFSLYNVLPLTILIISLIITIIMSLKSKTLSSKKLFSGDSLDISAVENVDFDFTSVAGNEEAKESVNDIVDFLKNPEKYASYGARIPKGIILYGEPGTGKTLLAKAVAGEANVPFYAMTGSDFVQIYVGVGASRIRQLFKKARTHGKAVIFIDEIDAIGKKRESGQAGGSDERDQTLNALLTEMSGFNEKEGIVVIAATNRLDMLDSALLRPGRFDRHIEVALPDLSARKKIIDLHLKNKPVGKIDIEDLSYKTAYFSGAKLESLINEAAILACKDESNFIESEHIDKAYSIVIAGHEKINRSHISKKDMKITAFHEAGHALLSLKLLPFEKVSKVTIIPSTKGAGGYTLSIPEDTLYQNKDYITKKIMVLLGGRIAEDLIFSKDFVTTGAYSDLKESTKLVKNMVTQYGMGDSLGLLNFSELSSLGPNIGNDITSECKDTLNSLYNEGRKLLSDNINVLNKLSEELLKKETLIEDEILEIVNYNS
ncbi:cell division protease FtsH [Clostridium acidisoli DSM 12555]|uniref:Cell division protease FtsH n=1 Tax=Clostridium acidisoli DSM 12555 TaxID=1121291 RepID=A0A1W1XPS3_9CLOT|nr:FtsH/Yme1/Tma family ATP-dependent metallopeptidase [Clostridium acidisoli]SMC25855.1 cell division protease FtsH [Clostridium acidisoli DSM 12555]